MTLHSHLLFGAYYSYIKLAVVGHFPSGLKEIDRLLHNYYLSTESQIVSSRCKCLSAEVEVTKGKKFIVTSHFYTFSSWKS